MGRSILVNLRKIFPEVQTKDLSDAKLTLDIMVMKTVRMKSNLSMKYFLSLRKYRQG
jgi:hypothetical protein